ncbi:septal ring lytic transglycosylase RlpA family protein [Bdellovibrio sp. HCB290]|uniref:septal ring lytic transglycosylase RlpA family protein n=1 Tax=Bdellovibrio sp. HCB290 TaxID=3394356 RepID=UPI0039B6E76F
MSNAKLLLILISLFATPLLSQGKTFSGEAAACAPKSDLQSQLKEVSDIVNPQLQKRSEMEVPGYNSCGGKQKGIASVYGIHGRDNFAGKRTASGEKMRPEKLRAAILRSASKQYPMGSWVRVTSGERSVVVCINDKGGGKRGRVIDLSAAASKQLGGDDLTRVEVECLLKPSDGPGRCDDKVAAHISANDF